MNSKQFTESTTSGSVASVSVPIGKMHSRMGKGVYPNEKKGNLFTGKKTNKKFANSVKESLVNEIDFASALGELQIPNKEIIKSSVQAGTIGSRNVFLYQNGKDKIYFFTENSKIEALVYLYDSRLMAMKNYSNNKGLIYNLFQYIINIEKQKVKLLPIDKLTSDGITWIIGQLNRPDGFKITDLNNKPINADELYNEWKKAHETGKSGPTGIIIGESKNSRRIRENETRLMPMDTFGATLTKLDTITENLINIDNLVKESNISEIGYADKLDDDSYSTDDILKIGKVVGNIENNDVLYAQDGDEKIYFLVVEGEVTAFVGFNKNFLKNIKNFTKSAGVVRALIGFLVHIKGEQLVVSADELLTPDGIKWLIHLINSPRGLNIRDQEGNLVDPSKLKKKWLKARETGSPGPTSITISENIVFGKKLRENEINRKEKSLLMSFNLYNTNEIKNMKKIGQDNKKFVNTVKESNQQGVVEGSSTDDKKQISKYEELALAANRAGDDEKCKLYQKKIQALKQKMSKKIEEGSDELKVGIEAYGVRGVNSKKWKKTFKSQEAFEKWLDQNKRDVEVSGTREVNLNDMFKESMKEAKLDEEDIIIVPGQGKKYKQGLITKDKDRTDHEVEMALSDLFQSAKNAKQVYEMLKTVPETVGIEGWVQEKIIKASDYLNTVREYLEHKQVDRGMTEESMNTPKKKSVVSINNSESMSEGLEDDFSSFLQDLEKNTGIKGTIRKPGEKQSTKPEYKPTPVSAEERERLASELSEIEKEMRELKPYKDDSWSKRDRWSALSIRRNAITSRLKDNVEEGVLAKTGGALAIIAALMGGNELTSAKHTPLGKALATAAQQGDQEAAKHLANLDTYIDTKQSALVTKLSNKYLGDPSLREGVIGGERPKETKKEDDRITAAYRKKYLPKDNKKNKEEDAVKKESSIMKGLMKEQKCPECGGKLVAENELNEENKDACYQKVKSRYKVWPSAYASGALVQCRKKGASNWGNKSK
jgi:hypothetical protein